MEKRIYKNETKLNQEELVRLLAKQTLPLSKFFVSVGSIVVLLSLLIIFWDKEDPGLYIAMTVLLSVGLVGLVLLYLGKKWLIKVSNKSLSNGVTYQYEFYDKGLRVDSILGEKTSTTQIQYVNLEKVIFRGEIVYLYFNNVSIFFVDLNNFNEDEKEEVTKILMPYTIKKSKR